MISEPEENIYTIYAQYSYNVQFVHVVPESAQPEIPAHPDADYDARHFRTMPHYEATVPQTAQTVPR